jgi:hypothetical protein
MAAPAKRQVPSPITHQSMGDIELRWPVIEGQVAGIGREAEITIGAKERGVVIERLAVTIRGLKTNPAPRTAP